jgi:hypothetical protein
MCAIGARAKMRGVAVDLAQAPPSRFPHHPIQVPQSEERCLETLSQSIMKLPRVAFLVVMLAVIWPGGAFAANGATQGLSPKAACDRLRGVISKQLHPEHGAAEYRCDEAMTDLAAGYYVFALRSNYPAPEGAGAGWAGSSLVGWYAIRISDGKVLDWNVATLELGRVIE